MSYPIFSFPTPPHGSWTWPIKRTPKYATLTQTPVSLRGQLNISLTPYPIWEYEIGLGYLRGAIADPTSAVNQIAGFFAAAAGAAGLWLFADPFDSTATAQQFGTGDGSTTAFQMQRPLGAYGGVTAYDLIQNLNGTPSIYVNGTLTTPASISATGLVTFSTAPVAGATLTWTGSFYYLCHFTEDTISDLQALQTLGAEGLLWSAAMKFETVLL